MMEEMQYWLIEYGKVCAGYSFLMFVWPMCVFRNYLRGKGLTFRFGFCVTAQTVILNTVVLLLGLCHLLNRFTVASLFWGVLLFSCRREIFALGEKWYVIRYLMTGTYGWKNFSLKCYLKIKSSLKKIFGIMWSVYRKRFVEYTLLTGTVLYGMLYFSWGVLQRPSYGYSDLYVHHSWIYQLLQGNAFSAGVYPEGMHCMVAALHDIFGLQVMNSLLFVSGMNVVCVLLAAYCFLKEIFACRYSALFTLILFLTYNVSETYILAGMTRMQCALPQEMGFPAAFLCAAYLIRYLKSEHSTFRKNEKSKLVWNENLVIFTLALASTIAIHFYATIMSFFICVGIAVIGLGRIFNRKRFVPLVASALLGVLLAVAPMGVGLATGIPFQGSIGWAMEVINGSSDEESTTEQVPTEEDEIIPDSEMGITDDTQEWIPGLEETPAIEEVPIVDTEGSASTTEAEEESVFDKIASRFWGLVQVCSQKLSELYEQSYVDIYGQPIAQWIQWFELGICLGAVGCKGITGVYAQITRKKRELYFADTYLMLLGASFIYMVFYSPKIVGLPSLVEQTRLGFMGHFLVVAIMIVPIDIMMAVLRKIRLGVLQAPLALAIFAGILWLVCATGNYHRYLFFELTRYNASVNATKNIMESLPKESYTIVSPTEELYQVIGSGYHEEILTFLEMQEKETYTLPTEYVFLYVEKQAFHYTQYHFTDGPAWLARDGYEPYFASKKSRYPEYFAYEVSKADAKEEMLYFEKRSDSYANPESRIILQAKMQEWCKEFDKTYPNELKLYYEDAYFACYYFRQNTQKLFELALE